MDGAGRGPPCGRTGRGVPGIFTGSAGFAEHCEVLRAGVGVVVAVPGAVRAGLGCGDVGELRGVPVLVADRGRPAVASIERRRAFAESTIAARLVAVISCYDYHVLNGVDWAETCTGSLIVAAVGT